jgi:hypothetical protein
MFAVSVALGALVFGSVLFVLTRVAGSWQVGHGGTPRSVSVLGQRWGYPAANASALAIAVLAGFGLMVLVVTIRAAVREMRAAAAFGRALEVPARTSAVGARIVEDDRPQAFCAGLFRPCVYVSRGALGMLDAGELRAVLAHEHHHARRRDPLRLAATRVLGEALFFVPPLRELVRRQDSLAEIGADEAAVAALGGDRAALASAMLSFSEANGTGAEGLAPERIDHLIGEGRLWRVPVVSLLVTCVCVAALVVLAGLAAGSAHGSATLALPLLSAQPCVVMLALVPAGAVAAGLLCARRRTRPLPAVMRHARTPG